MRVILSASIMDLCHQGHINLLKKMRAEGDKVIMVIHDDKSCYDIKGKFPIQSTNHRKRNILLTGLVDEVLITKSVDPSDQFKKVVEKYSKHEIVFMRGDDNKNFPGKWFINCCDMPIKYVPYTKGISSTKIRKYLCG